MSVLMENLHHYRHHEVEIWARPVRDAPGVYTERARRDDRPDQQGAERRQRSLSRVDGPASPGAAGTLLPDARIAAGRRGRSAGDAAGGMAGPRSVRGTRLDPHLALSDRDQSVSQCASI